MERALASMQAIRVRVTVALIKWQNLVMVFTIIKNKNLFIEIIHDGEKNISDENYHL